MKADEKAKSGSIQLGRLFSFMFLPFLVLLFIKSMLNQTLSDANVAEISFLFVVIHFIFVTILFLSFLPSKTALIIALGLLFRVLLLVVDRFTTVEMPFIGNSGDAEGFFVAATRISEDLSIAGETYGGAYTALLGYLFYFVGIDRVIGQYVNVLLGIISIILLAKILEILEISEKISAVAIFLAAFMPLVAIHSVMLLRESIIQVLVTVGLYFFVRGIFENRFLWTALSLAAIAGASIFHAGVVGVLFGFALVSAFTYREEGKFSFGIKRITPAILIGFAIIGALLRYPELFLGKFQSLESPDDLIETGLSGRGGSAYLTGIEVTDWFTFILYAPLRAFYFATSPLPWDWRGAGDILAFGLDSVVYFAVIGYFLFSKIGDKNKRYLALAFAFALLITCLVFGVGVSNSGTAIRHRAKLIAIFLVLFALLLDSRRKKLSRLNKKFYSSFNFYSGSPESVVSNDGNRSHRSSRRNIDSKSFKRRKQGTGLTLPPDSGPRGFN